MGWIKPVIYISAIIALIGFYQYSISEAKDAGYNAAKVEYQQIGIENAQQISLAYAAEIERINAQADSNRIAGARLRSELNAQRESYESRIEILKNAEYNTCDGYIVIDNVWLHDYNTDPIRAGDNRGQK